jgi:hypothetical protein
MKVSTKDRKVLFDEAEDDEASTAAVTGPVHRSSAPVAPCTTTLDREATRCFTAPKANASLRHRGPFAAQPCSPFSLMLEQMLDATRFDYEHARFVESIQATQARHAAENRNCVTLLPCDIVQGWTELLATITLRRDGYATRLAVNPESELAPKLHDAMAELDALAAPYRQAVTAAATLASDVPTGAGRPH